MLVIKGVGHRQRPPTKGANVRSCFYGIHYVVGSERNPRVVELHLCLVLPQRRAPPTTSAAAEAQRAASGTGGRLGESWAERTFGRMRKVCERDGLFASSTIFEEKLCDPLGVGGEMWRSRFSLQNTMGFL